MRIVVCGAGVVGSGIARQLALEENDVTVIDNNPETIARLNDTLDVKAVRGFASHPQVLEDAGVQNADMIIAVTQSDEVNMVACQVARSLFNVQTTVARIRNQQYLLPEYGDMFRQEGMPIDHIISPEIEVAETILQRFQVPGAMDSITFADGKIRVVEVRCVANSPLVDQSLTKVQEALKPFQATVLGLVRGSQLIFPDMTDTLTTTDEIYIAVVSQYIPQAMALFGYQEKEAKRVVIVGGGNIGLYLGERLLEQEDDITLTMIDYNKARAEFVSAKLPQADVLCGNALDEEILNEANVGKAEMLVAISNDDEVNILCSLLAKRLGCKRAVTLVNSMSLTPLVDSLGIDVTINPRETTVSTILHHIRRGRIKAAHSILSGTAEIIETEIVSTSPVLGQTLRDLNLPAGISVAMIVRRDHIMLPDKDIIFQEKDRVLILCHTAMIKKVDKLFAMHGEYF